MTISLSRAKSLARTLLRENRKNGRSWRVIAREDFNDQINNTTICRFAISKGTWLPKDERILLALGLIKPRAPKPKQKTVKQMNNREFLEHVTTRVSKLNALISERNLNYSITLKRGASQ